jgi:hypothetical protein
MSLHQTPKSLRLLVSGELFVRVPAPAPLGKWPDNKVKKGDRLMPKKQPSSRPIVFISHSHRDRHVAVELQGAVEENGAETYLDQERIEPGARLTKKIRDLINSCNTFILIWSASAASSTWVRREWKLALESRKKIIPYCLDSSSLPPELEDLVYIDLRDREHGDSQLLRTVFGRGFRPIDPTKLFPGHWRASANIGGIMEATYDLELRENGQVEGTGGLSQSAVMAPGAEDLMKMRIPFHGSWSYDPGAKLLTIKSTVTLMGRKDRETIRVHTTGHEKGAISGQDLGGRIWTLWRVDESATSDFDEPKRQARHGVPTPSPEIVCEPAREVRDPQFVAETFGLLLGGGSGDPEIDDLQVQLLREQLCGPLLNLA